MNRTLNILKCLLLLFVVGAFIVPSATAIEFLNIGLSNYGAGEVSAQYFNFQLQQNLPANGKIKIIYPEGFNISEATKYTPAPKLYYSTGSEDFTLVIDVPTRTLVVQRDGAGGDLPVGITVAFYLDNITNPPTLGEKTITVYTTFSNDVPTGDSGSDNVNIVAGPATHFTLDTISDQVAGTAFPITVKARDQFENIDTNYNAPPASLSSRIGTITPNSIDFVDGTGTDNIIITKIGTGNITATAGTIKGASNEFTVKPAALGSFVIATIPNQYDEQAFTVTAQAKDTEGNNKTDYNAVNNLTVNPGVPGTVTIVSPSPATVQFVNGRFSGQVTLNVDPDPTPTALQTGVSLTITNTTVVPPISRTSNDFSISLPVDLKNSTVVAVPTKVIEDGISTSTITVTVKNGISQGNISGASVVLTSSGVGRIIPAINTTDSHGQAKFTIDSTAPGTVKLTATVWGTEVLEQKPVVTFGFDNLLHLAKGWNLVSVPRKLNDNSLSALATDKVNKIYYYDTANDEWKFAIYTSGTWNGTLTTIDDGKGYWMNATAPANVPVVLKSLDNPILNPPPDYPLKAGWNLIGYTSYQLNPLLTTDIDIYLLSLRNPNSGFPLWVSAYRWTGSGYEQAKPTNIGFPNVVRTEGYWLYLNSDGTLTP